MARRIRIRAGPVEAAAELNDTGTARAIWQALPFEGRAGLWGEEIYFSIPLRIGLEAGQELVAPGDLGYWPEGPAFCIFFGPTPVSRGDEIRPASAVTVFGKIVGDAAVFREVASGVRVTVERAEE